MIATSNTGPLIALAKVDALGLLKNRFGAIQVPPAVHRELLAKVGPEAKRLDDAFSDFVRISPAPTLSPEESLRTLGLGQGEQQALALAHQSGTILIIDDKLARRAATQLDLNVTGTVGLIVEASRQGRIVDVREILERIRRDGYWLSDALVEAACRKASAPREG
jgi:predicted nucleic acid-binding protein